MDKVVSGRFFEKKLRKKLLLWGPWVLETGEQKFFAALFFKKARTFLNAS